ncbi:hypothetical protein B0H17DRAFT_222001 [Mycena rosella]|uniref:F-box domain-containing protein n=1 Tax=Mycena rosella TaxID=1033263 RepID=A0AAD7G5I9_MYCRO|nr:hypothetical protein B0H17DRAFT_222001 [Mycena rosella]
MTCAAAWSARSLLSTICTMPAAVGLLEIVQNAGNRSPPTLPPELLDRIIEFALELRRSVHSTSLHSNIETLAPLTLVSIQFRALALRHYFRHVFFAESGKENSPWNALCRSGEKWFTWVRSLRASSKTLAFHSDQLAALTNLQELSLDLGTEGLFTQHPILKQIFRYLLSGSSPINNINPSHTLTVLTLTSLPRIDIPLLRLITDSFPRLVDLHLSCTERLDLHCCWCCYEESFGITIHSPVPDMFSRSRDMAIAFAHILRPLKQLAHLHLGVYLSDEMLVHVHLDHGQAEGEFPFGPEQCILCEEAAAEVQLRELAAGLELAQYLKALRTIGFSSFFDDAAYYTRGRRLDETTVYVLRENGRIRVRKTPWPRGETSNK